MGRPASRKVVALILSLTMPSALVAGNSQLTIPEIESSPKRAISIEDVIGVRAIDTLSVSPDGRQFAIFVRQADPLRNDYRTGWFVGGTNGGTVTYVGGGGIVLPSVRKTGHMIGEIAVNHSRWSPDGQWIAYTLRRDNEVQLWRSRADGGVQEQVTHSTADVQDFAWSEDGSALYFTVGDPRSLNHERELAKSRRGYNYDEDLFDISDLLKPRVPAPASHVTTWIVQADGEGERLAEHSETAAFARIQRSEIAGLETSDGFLRDFAGPPVAARNGAQAWLARSGAGSRILRVMMSPVADGAHEIACDAEPCIGAIRKVWWTADGRSVIFWRREGINDRAHGFYVWSPWDKRVTTILRSADEHFDLCSEIADDQVLCVRETADRPPHLVALDISTRSLRVICDVNPEFRNIRLGKSERFEWETPKFRWIEPGGRLAELYPKRAYGYILYPPDFDPTRTYPVFIDPYVAQGFNSSFGSEHALQVYAAQGFIVLNMNFPTLSDAAARLGPSLMRELYSADLDFPHLTMLMESTVAGLDAATARGFIDGQRVGIGGVSHGSFVPLYMLQKHDLIAAISISSPGWGPHEYYAGTRRGRSSIVASKGNFGYQDWRVSPNGAGREYWRKIDIADHVDTIKAPVLVNLAAAEANAVVPLIRHMENCGKAYDAYVFLNETHIKWQPAHLYSIMVRNLDWFRFWLQGYEDPDPTKTEQYTRWRSLKVRHDANRNHPPLSNDQLCSSGSA